MTEFWIVLVLGAVVAAIFGLPLFALYRTLKIEALERRIEGLEAALLRVMAAGAPPVAAAPAGPVAEPAEEFVPAPAAAEAPAPETVEIPAYTASSAAPLDAQAPYAAPPKEKGLEQIIGERWLGWAGIAVILFGAAFGLKYAFENRWIGELGRVMLGVVAGIAMLGLGWQRHRAGWRTFSQIFTAGGATLVYLSVYAAYGFYDLVPAGAAFAFLALIVVQTHLLAVAYHAPAIAVMGQIGGYLTPILLSTGQDRYGVLFSYLALLAAGAALVCLLRNWGWIGSVSFVLAHALFWGWHGDHYHPEKLVPALAFQAALYLIFAVADLAPASRGRSMGVENWFRLFANPFVFFATAYSLLDPEYPAWMGAFALSVGALYAAGARWSLDGADRRLTIVLAAVSGAFVTLAIPIQLDGDWTALAWGLQAAALVWVGARLGAPGWLWGAGAIFVLALGAQFVQFDAWGRRPEFTPFLNTGFLGAAGLVASLAAAAWFVRQRSPRSMAIALGLAAAFVLWLSATVEIYSYFDSLERALSAEDYDRRGSLRRIGHATLSVVWALFAAALVGGGMRFGLASARWAGLALFGITVLKAFFVDIPTLEGGYRVAALLALGLLLLGAGWKYQRIRRSAGEQEAP